MAAMFSKPKTPKVPEPPKPPQIDDAALAAEEEQRQARRQGRGAAMLTGDKGLSNLGSVGTKMLLGA